MKGLSQLPTKEELRQNVIELATPIDFEQLIRDGILEKDGAWYKVHNFKRLPRHASIKVKTMETGPKGLRVKFRPITKSTLKLLKQIGGAA